VVAVDERTGVLTVSFDHLTLDPPHLHLGDVIAAQYYEHKGYLSLKDVATRLRSPIWVVSCVWAISKFAPSWETRVSERNNAMSFGRTYS